MGLVKIESSEGITTITMARPEKRNALTQELCDGLYEAYRAFEHGDLVVTMLEGAVGLEQLVTQLLGQGVALLGARHGDGGDAFAGFDFDQAHFSRPPAFLLAG